MSWHLEQGDCREVLKQWAADGVLFDSCVTDPPYDLTSIVKRFGKAGAAPAKSNGATGVYGRASKGFMGQTWDGTGVAFDPETWRAVYDVLKPGAHLVAFGGTRTSHRMTCAIEDAGFEIRDSLCWLYGTGFPKSHDVSKGIDKHFNRKGIVEPTGNPIKRLIPGATQYSSGSWVKDDGREYQPGTYIPASPEAEQWTGWGTALKPAYEPIIFARKPLEGTVAGNTLAWGVGGINIDGCRVGNSKRVPGSVSHTDGAIYGSYGQETGMESGHNPNIGRWPANLLHDGSPEVLEAFAQFGEAPAQFGEAPRSNGACQDRRQPERQRHL